MKLVLLKEDGAQVEIKQIQGLPKDAKILFFFIDRTLRRDDLEEMENYIQNKVNQKVVILDASFRDVILGQ
jgi:hypothetical protein